MPNWCFEQKHIRYLYLQCEKNSKKLNHVVKETLKPKYRAVHNIYFNTTNWYATVPLYYFPATKKYYPNRHTLWRTLGLSKLGEFRWLLFLSQEVHWFPWQIPSAMRYLLLVPLLVRDSCVQKGWLCLAWGVYLNFGITLKTGVQEPELVSHAMQTLLGKFSCCMTKSQTGKGARAERDANIAFSGWGRWDQIHYASSYPSSHGQRVLKNGVLVWGPNDCKPTLTWAQAELN